MIRRYLRGLVIPGWLPTVAAVALAFATYFYIDWTARKQERALVTAEVVTAQADAKDAAQKHFAERASEAAAAIAALDKIHAAAVAERDQSSTALESAWTTVVEKAPVVKAKGTAECWPVAVVAELRK